MYTGRSFSGTGGPGSQQECLVVELPPMASDRKLDRVTLSICRCDLDRIRADAARRGMPLETYLIEAALSTVADSRARELPEPSPARGRERPRRSDPLLPGAVPDSHVSRQKKTTLPGGPVLKLRAEGAAASPESTEELDRFSQLR